MDALKSSISTRSLVILSNTSSLRGSALRLLSFRVRVQAQTQKAAPQRSRQNVVVSKPGGYPISFRSTVHAMPQNLQENVLRNTLQHATILFEAPRQCMNASFLLRNLETLCVIPAETLQPGKARWLGSLAEERPDLVKEWAQDLNGDVTPESVSAGSKLHSSLAM